MAEKSQTRSYEVVTAMKMVPRALLGAVLGVLAGCTSALNADPSDLTLRAVMNAACFAKLFK